MSKVCQITGKKAMVGIMFLIPKGTLKENLK